MAIAIDDFIDSQSCAELISRFPPRDMRALKQRAEVAIPASLEMRLRSVLSGDLPTPVDCCDDVSAEITVPVPARIASGSIPWHQDCFNPYDAADCGWITGSVVILYLSGGGRFFCGEPGNEQAIQIKPGRVISWPNNTMMHRFEAPEGGSERYMIGPLAVHTDNDILQQAHDCWSLVADIAKSEADMRAATAALQRKNEKANAECQICVTVTWNSNGSSGCVITCSSVAGEIIHTKTCREDLKTLMEIHQAGEEHTIKEVIGHEVAEKLGCDLGSVAFVKCSGEILDRETTLSYGLQMRVNTTKHIDGVTVYITPLAGGEQATVLYRLQDEITLGMLRDKVAEIFCKPSSDLKLLADSTRLLTGPDSEVIHKPREPKSSSSSEPASYDPLQQWHL